MHASKTLTGKGLIDVYYLVVYLILTMYHHLEYMRDCQVPGNSFLFAKVLTLLVLSREVEEKKEEEDFRVVVVKKIYDTLMQLKG